MKRAVMLAVTLLLTVAIAPSMAFAGEVTSHVVSRTDGVEILRQMVGQFRGLEVGATAATLTVDVDGTQRPVRIGMGGSGTSAGEGAGPNSGFLTLAAMPFLAGALLRLLRFLARLGAA